MEELIYRLLADRLEMIGLNRIDSIIINGNDSIKLIFIDY